MKNLFAADPTLCKFFFCGVGTPMERWEECDPGGRSKSTASSLVQAVNTVQVWGSQGKTGLNTHHVMDDGREYKMIKSREQHWRETEKEGSHRCLV